MSVCCDYTKLIDFQTVCERSDNTKLFEVSLKMFWKLLCFLHYLTGDCKVFYYFGRFEWVRNLTILIGHRNSVMRDSVLEIRCIVIILGSSRFWLNVQMALNVYVKLTKNFLDNRYRFHLDRVSIMHQNLCICHFTWLVNVKKLPFCVHK